MPPQFRQIDVEAVSSGGRWNLWVPRLVWGFVFLGIAIRFLRYALRFPLCVDESMLAQNFLERGFLDLLTPLEDEQIAPTGFLWIELACVRLFGFSEWSLRLFPLICGISSLFVFRHLASRVLAGVPLVLAVGCLAIFKPAVGLSADIKPYASDLLVALVLLTLLVEWLRRPEKTVWLWRLCAAIPVALLFSFPAVFVGGAISVGLIASVARLRNRQTWVPYVVFNAVLVAMFGATLLINAGSTSFQTRQFMDAYWLNCGGFPPLSEPLRLATWLIDVHLGDRIFCIPYGSENGGGSISLICFAIGAFVMYRHGQRPLLTTFLAMFALGLLAAAMRRYPYGGHIRLVQYLVPAICLAVGTGGATLLGYVRQPRFRGTLAAGVMLALALFGAGFGVRQVLRPYEFVGDLRHREFAEWFWRDQPGRVTICLQADLETNCCAAAFDPFYRCNQRIYSEPHHNGRRLPLEAVKDLHQPLRLVVYHPTGAIFDSQKLTEVLARIELDYQPTGHDFFDMPQKSDGFKMYGAYEVFQFAPRRNNLRLAGRQPEKK
jgi:hypothetical protein